MYLKAATIVPQNETKKVTLAIKKQSDQSWLIVPYKECLPPSKRQHVLHCTLKHQPSSSSTIFSDQILFEEKQHWWKCRLYKYTKYLIMSSRKQWKYFDSNSTDIWGSLLEKKLILIYWKWLWKRFLVYTTYKIFHSMTKKNKCFKPKLDWFHLVSR
jgi:hypothetical protein